MVFRIDLIDEAVSTHVTEFVSLSCSRSPTSVDNLKSLFSHNAFTGRMENATREFLPSGIQSHHTPALVRTFQVGKIHRILLIVYIFFTRLFRLRLVWWLIDELTNKR